MSVNKNQPLQKLAEVQKRGGRNHPLINFEHLVYQTFQASVEWVGKHCFPIEMSEQVVIQSSQAGIALVKLLPNPVNAKISATLYGLGSQ